MFETFIILISLLTTLVAAYLSKIWLAYSYFKKKGIKTPPYKFLYGNWRDVDLKQNHFEQLQEWTKQYGKTYGYYLGHRPVLVTSDIKLVEEVFIKQSHNFSARIDRIDFLTDDSVLTAEKGKWKRLRNIMNPTFSSAKLKDMVPVMEKCVDRLTSKIALNTNVDIKLSDLLNRFTMDTIWNCAFGIDINPQEDVNNPYFKRSQDAFVIPVDFGFVFFITNYLHEFRKVIIRVIKALGDLTAWFDRSKLLPVSWLFHHIMDVIEVRTQEGKSASSKKDYLQILLDAQGDSKELKDEFDKSVNYNDIHLNKKLTLNEINANLVLFLLAGYETTSNTLSSCLFTLSKNPEEQKKLIDEFNEYFPTIPENPTYEEINSLPYLDMFVKEVLRLYPIIPLNRRCVNPTTALGIEFEEGISMDVDILSVHHDSELWGPVDTNEFYPSRHAPEEKRNPLALCTFGLGPRNCLGRKFAMLEIKIALFKILTKYEILPTTDKDFKLEFVQIGIRLSKNGIKVVCKPREKM